MPIRFVAMGLVIVFLEAPISGYDALPDPVGWALVAGSLVRVRPVLPQGSLLLGLGLAAGAVSVPLVLPGLGSGLDESGQWAASVPQTVFCIALSRALAALLTHSPGAGADGGPDTAGARTRLASRLRLLAWVYAVLLAAPVVVYGGGVAALTTPLAVVAVLANVALVWLTFRAAGQPDRA